VYDAEMAQIAIGELAGQLNELVERVAVQRERVVVTDGGSPVAVLVSPEELADLQEGRAIADYLMQEPNAVTWARLGLRNRA
jgi:prevent-host-death family protein